MKDPLTPPGIEPATFRFLAQHLNHCASVALWNDEIHGTDRSLHTVRIKKLIHILVVNLGAKFNLKDHERDD